MPTVTSGASTIHYLDAGAPSATPVVLVHSGGMSSRQWSRLSSRLASTHRPLAIDLLGIGGSSPVPRDAPFHYTEDVAALDALLDTLPARYHLVGHSYGGLVALTAARARPDRVLSLALYEPVAFGVLYSVASDPALADLAAAALDGVRELDANDRDGAFLDDAAGGGAAWMERFIDYWNGPGSFRAMPEPTRAGFLAVGRKVYQEVRSLMGDRTPHAAYAAVTAPALLATGKRSTRAAQAVCATLARALPRGRLVVLDDAGHMGPLTHAQTVNDLIVSHLTDAERRASPRG